MFTLFNFRIRKTRFSGTLLLFLICSSGSWSQADEWSPDLLIRDVHVIVGLGDRTIPNATVRISGGLIASIETGLKATPQASGPTRTIQGRGLYLIPGLWDMHVHLTDATESSLSILVANGVTGVRDMGGDLEYLDRLRNEIRSGERVGPRIMYAGPYLDGPKKGAPYRRTLSTPEDARVAVTELAQRQVDFLKVHNGVSPEVYSALVDSAHENDLQLVGHVPTGVSPVDAAAAGQASVEHVATLFEGTFLARFKTPPALLDALGRYEILGGDKVRRIFVEMETRFTPTLLVYVLRARRSQLAKMPDPRLKFVANSLIEQWDQFFPVTEKDSLPAVIEGRRKGNEHFLRITGWMHDGGVRILAGTDLGARDIIPGFSLHDELALLRDAGLSSGEILELATLGAAEFLGLDSRVGTIEVGKEADLILLEKNPLEKIEHTRKIVAVILRGRYIGPEEIDSLLSEGTDPGTE